MNLFPWQLAMQTPIPAASSSVLRSLRPSGGGREVEEGGSRPPGAWILLLLISLERLLYPLVCCALLGGTEGREERTVGFNITEQGFPETFLASWLGLLWADLAPTLHLPHWRPPTLNIQKWPKAPHCSSHKPNSTPNIKEDTYMLDESFEIFLF